MTMRDSISPPIIPTASTTTSAHDFRLHDTFTAITIHKSMSTTNGICNNVINVDITNNW